jgi:hypothetical protein
MDDMRVDVVLIGPINAGKSTVAALLGRALGWPVVDLDELSDGYYAEIGYDEQEAERRKTNGGIRARYDYWKPFEIHALERMLADHATRTCVFDLGAGHAVYEDPVLLARARRALAPYRNVVLLLPSPDPDESMRILATRLTEHADDPNTAPSAHRVEFVTSDLNRHLIEHHSFHDLATQTIYTAGRTAGDVSAEILKVVTG